MWFKNTTVYRLPDGAPSKADLADALLDLPFASCLGLDWFNEGFDSAAAFDDAPVFEADGSLRLALKREEKVLPAGVIRSILDEQVADIKRAEARNVGRKEKQEMKEQIIDDLLPRAFTRSSRIEALIDGKRGYLLVDNARRAKAENLLTRLREALGGINARYPQTRQSRTGLMTDWLAAGEAPGGFELGYSATLEGVGDVHPVIKISRKDLTDADVTAHINKGMMVTELELEWRDSVRFVLTRDFSLKRIEWLDVLQEEAEGGDDALSVMYASQVIQAAALGEIIDELAMLMGGWQD